MAGNIRIGAGVETPAQSRTSVSGGFSLPARPAPAPAPAGYQLVYQMGGPRYMYGETPRYAAQYSDGGTVPGQIYGNMRGSREGADMFGFFPTMFQSQPYATASQMYTPSLGVMPLIGYPSKYPHVVMGGYTDYGAPIANQAISMMLPLLMMGLYRQMFPMPGMGAAPAAAAKGSGGGGGGGKGGSGGGGGSSAPSKEKEPEFNVTFDPYAPGVGWDLRAEMGNELASNAHFLRDPERPGTTYYGTDNPGLAGVPPGVSGAEVLAGKSVPSQPSATRRQAASAAASAAALPAIAAGATAGGQTADAPVRQSPAAAPARQQPWIYEKVAPFFEGRTGNEWWDRMVNPH